MNGREYINSIDDSRAEGILLGIDAIEHGVIVPKQIMRACEGNAYDALLLSQIFYWHRLSREKTTRLKHEKDGFLWVAKSHEEWADELGFTSSRTVEGCMTRLAEKGLIIKSAHISPYHNGKKVAYVRLNWTPFIDSLIGPVPADSGNDGVPADSGNDGSRSEREPYTETIQRIPKTNSDAKNLLRRPSHRVGENDTPEKPKVSDLEKWLISEFNLPKQFSKSGRSKIESQMVTSSEDGIQKLGTPVELFKASELYMNWLKLKVEYMKTKPAEYNTYTRIANLVSNPKGEYGWAKYLSSNSVDTSAGEASDSVDEIFGLGDE